MQFSLPIIAVLAIVILVILKKRWTGKTTGPTFGPVRPDKPTTEIENDKIILVNNVRHDDIKKAVTDFCKIYNEKNFVALPRLWQISVDKYAITFPYDIDFITFCFAVNYLKYPTDIEWSANVKAWLTTKGSDEWIKPESADKIAMLFLATDDKEYDNVFLTTHDNIGYKLGFSGGRAIKLLDAPKERFVKNTTDSHSLTGLSFEDLM